MFIPSTPCAEENLADCPYRGPLLRAAAMDSNEPKAFREALNEAKANIEPGEHKGVWGAKQEVKQRRAEVAKLTTEHGERGLLKTVKRLNKSLEDFNERFGKS
jgi:creatinine amidohydrolase/Fe(II)-dependent formamide hydrolase-like protein